MRELRHRYHLRPSPTSPTTGHHAVPSTPSWPTSSAAGSPLSHRPSPSSSKPYAPANRSPTWKPNHARPGRHRHDPDHQRHHHDQRPDRRHRPARTQRERMGSVRLPGPDPGPYAAITATILADTADSPDLHQGHRLGRTSRAGAAELGLTGPDAITRAAQSPRASRSAAGSAPAVQQTGRQPNRPASQARHPDRQAAARDTPRSRPQTDSCPPGPCTNASSTTASAKPTPAGCPVDHVTARRLAIWLGRG